MATDPEASAMTLDPALVAIRSGLAPFRRRLWLRRIVRDATWLAALVVALELVLAVAGRLVPLGWAWSAALAIPVVGVVALLIDAVRVRPTVAETALALDGEQGLRDRLSSALEIALRSPELTMTMETGDAPDGAGRTMDPAADAELARETATYADFVRLQRRDALGSLRAADRHAFPPRLPRRPARVAAILALVLIPALVLPNPQTDTLAQRERQREAAERQAERLEQTADRLSEGRTADDPRADIAEELRRISRELRERPEDLEAQLARLGSLEDALRARLDPSNEQRAAALASLARSVSRLQSGQRQQSRRIPAAGRQGRRSTRRSRRRADARRAGAPRGRAGSPRGCRSPGRGQRSGCGARRGAGARTGRRCRRAGRAPAAR